MRRRAYVRRDARPRRRARRSRGAARATSSCSRRRARATTSSRTSSSAARSSGGWCRTLSVKRAQLESASSSWSRSRCRVRARHGLQRHVGVGRDRRTAIRCYVPGATGDLRRLGLVAPGRLSRGSNYRALKQLAPTLVRRQPRAAASRVLVVGQAVNGARRWVSFGPSRSSRRSSRSSRSRSGRPLTSPPAGAADAEASWRGRSGCSRASSASSSWSSPTSAPRSARLMLAAMLFVAGTPVRMLARRARVVAARRRCSRSGSSRTAARASSASSTPGTTRKAPASRSSRR